MDGHKATSKFVMGSRGQYAVSAFGVDQEGFPFNRSATKPQTVFVLGIKGNVNNNGRFIFINFVCLKIIDQKQM